MIIEILENGGIYAYYQEEKCIYVGKTTRPFKERDKEHRLGNSPFEVFYKQNSNLKLKILVDCNFCNMTKEQLDYLETCFIQALQPQLNENKINYEITYSIKPLKKEGENDIYKQLTKSEILIYEVIKTTEKSTITKKEVSQSLKTKVSPKTLERAMKHLCDLNILILKHTNGFNENVYEIVRDKNEN